MDELTAKVLAAPLRRTQLFAGASDEIIARLAAATVRTSFKKNELIVREGDAGDRMFLLIEGRARVMVAAAGNGDNITLATLGPSDSFGELSLLDGLPRSATVQALDSPTVVFALTRELFLDVLHSDSRLVEVLLKTLTVTLKRLTDKAADVAFLDVRQRSARYLVHRCQSKAKSSTKIELGRKAVEAELIAILGGSATTVADVLASFDSMGAVVLETQHVIVINEPLLREVALGLI